MPFLTALLAKTSWASIAKGSVVVSVLSALLFLYTSYTGMQEEIQRIKAESAVLQSTVTMLTNSLELQVRHQEKADSMYLELKSVYATLDKKLSINKATLTKLKSEKGTQNEKLLNTPLTPDIINIANGVPQR